jgi:hypothetical protein
MKSFLEQTEIFALATIQSLSRFVLTDYDLHLIGEFNLLSEACEVLAELLEGTGADYAIYERTELGWVRC